MFKKYKNRNKLYRFMYHLITGLAMVIFWRGAWGLMDLYLFPGNQALSYVVSIIFGLILLFINDFSASELSD